MSPLDGCSSTAVTSSACASSSAGSSRSTAVQGARRTRGGHRYGAVSSRQGRLHPADACGAGGPRSRGRLRLQHAERAEPSGVSEDGLGCCRSAACTVSPSPLSPAIWRVATARQPAERWSVQTTTGRAASEALKEDRLAGLLGPAPDVGLVTRKSPSFVRWRYGLDDLRYRIVESPDASRGVAVYRLRTRGSATEAAICELSAPGPNERSELLRQVLRSSGADYALYLATNGVGGAMSVPVPGGGPTLTWRHLRWTEMPDLNRWHLSLGDIELF